MLWKANYKGVNWRYNKRRRPPYAHAAGRVLVDDGMGHPLQPIKTLVRDGLMVFFHPGETRTRSAMIRLGCMHGTVPAIRLKRQSFQGVSDDH